MVKGLYTAYTGMLNEQNRMDIMTNNLANADTNGYKKRRQYGTDICRYLCNKNQRHLSI